MFFNFQIIILNSSEIHELLKVATKKKASMKIRIPVILLKSNKTVS